MGDTKLKGGNAVNNAVYGMGFIGAVVYYIASASSILDGLFGVFKAMLWPAFLVYELLKFLQM